MARHGSILTVSVLLGVGLGLSCSGDDGDEDGGNGGWSGGQGTGGLNFIGSNGQGGTFDRDGDGQADTLEAPDFEDGALEVSEAQLDVYRNDSCTGWVAAPEPLGASLFWVLDASS